jgi:UDP-glucose 4-epimerase
MAADRILITGATGFVGRYTTKALLDRGYRLTLIVRDINSCPPEWGRNCNVNIVSGVDLGFPNTLEAALATALIDVRAIVHLAGVAHIAKSDRADASALFMRVNAEATKKLADIARSCRISSFIHLSSLAAITANNCDTIIDDETVNQPVTSYGRSKQAAEQCLQVLRGEQMFVVSLRPPLIVGAEAKGNWRLLQSLAMTKLPLPFASVANKRSFISVQSVAESIVTLCSSYWPPNLSGNYCVSDPEPLSLPEVLTALRQGMGLSPRLLPCPPRAFAVLGALIGRRRQLAGLTGSLKVNPSRFFSTFAFTPTLPLEEAIQRAGATYAAARWSKDMQRK